MNISLRFYNLLYMATFKDAAKK